jgi:hypothetical protein
MSPLFIHTPLDSHLESQQYLTLSTKLKLAEDHEKGYLKALNSKKKKRKRGQPFTEDLGVEEGVSMLFLSPSKVQKAREL